MAKIEHLRPEGLQNNPAYSHTVVASGARTIYISGQVAQDENGALVGAGDLGAQTTQVMHNLKLALAAAGATFADGVKRGIYVVGYTPEMRPVIAAARAPHFPEGKPPASTLVGVQALAAPGWLIEIEAIAVTG